MCKQGFIQESLLGRGDWACEDRPLAFFAEVKIFRFWPKTIDYNKVFLPKSR